MADRQTDRQASREPLHSTSRLTDRQAEIHYRLTDRQADWQTGRRMDRETDSLRQTDRQTFNV